MKINIKTKLIGGFLFVVVLLVGVVYFGYSGLNTLNDHTKAVFDQSQQDFQWARMQAYNNREIATYVAYTINQNDAYLTQAENQNKLAGECLNTLSTMIGPDQKVLYNTIVGESARVREITQSMVAAYQAHNTQSGNEWMDQLKAANSQLTTDVNTAIDQSHQATLALLDVSQSSKNSTVLLMLIIAAVAVLIALGLGLFLSQSISGGIRKVNQALKRMAASDLTVRVKIKSSDEIGEMADSYNELLDERIKVVKRLRSSANQIKAAGEQLAAAAEQSGLSTQQVASSSQQMAKGAQEQSTSAQETANSVKQLSETISQLAQSTAEQSNGVQKTVKSITGVSETMAEAAQHATQAAQGASRAAESAAAGFEKSRLTLSGMDKIKLSSSKAAKSIEELGSRSTEIGKIVAVIDDIAAQTNLLALNAAIEAARAGDQGRGFAVVSDEVRKLAERTATATKEIADLIGNVQKGVTEATQATAEGNTAVVEGYNMAVQAGQALEEIRKSSSQVNVEVEQISHKAQQVNTSINELVKIIENVGSITEENSAATEEMSASAVQVSRSVETVAGIAEENSAATEQVSASAQEMNAQIEEIAASSQSLKELARTLETSMAGYKLSDE
jgi:methyl-accepting chemotaxis protein